MGVAVGGATVDAGGADAGAADGACGSASAKVLAGAEAVGAVPVLVCAAGATTGCS
jgi:hypothetical protein